VFRTVVDELERALFVICTFESWQCEFSCDLNTSCLLFTRSWSLRRRERLSVTTQVAVFTRSSKRVVAGISVESYANSVLVTNSAPL